MTDKAKRGRPKVDDPRVHNIGVWLSSREYRAVLDHARRYEKSLSAAVRDRLFARRAMNLPSD